MGLWSAGERENSWNWRVVTALRSVRAAARMLGDANLDLVAINPGFDPDERGQIGDVGMVCAGAYIRLSVMNRHDELMKVIEMASNLTPEMVVDFTPDW